MNGIKSACLVIDSGLPFLYETHSIQTLLRQPRCPRRIRARRWQSSTAGPGTATNISHSHEEEYIPRRLEQADEDAVSSPRPSASVAPQRTPRQPSFLQRKAQEVASRAPAAAPVETPESAPQTITRDERMTFKRIFENLAHGRPVSADPEPVDTPHGFERAETRPGVDLQALLATTDPDKILEELYGAQTRRRNEGQILSTQAARDEVSQYPAALRRMALRAHAAVASTRSDVPGDLGSAASTKSGAEDARAAEVRSICAEALRGLSKALKEAARGKGAGEYPVLDICEKYVFKLLTPTVAEASSPDKKNKRKSKSKATKQVPESAVAGFDSMRSLHMANGEITIPKHIPPMDVLSNLCPASVTLVLRHLTSAFPSSPTILSLLPSLHSKGPEAYVLGSSTPLYNTLLAHRWDQYSDWQAMERLLIDMQEGAVSFDLTTLQIIDSIREERFFTLAHGSLGENSMDETQEKNLRPAWWWQMESNAIAFKSLTEQWRQIIVESLETTETAEDIPDFPYSDEMLDSIRQQPQEPSVIL